MGNCPIVELGDKTPLHGANHPVMDQQALEGQLWRFRMYKLWEKFFA
jgi:2,3-bisphosphoglycerate-independent phosphoglycerate mutase